MLALQYLLWLLFWCCLSLVGGACLFWLVDKHWKGLAFTECDPNRKEMVRILHNK